LIWVRRLPGAAEARQSVRVGGVGEAFQSMRWLRVRSWAAGWAPKLGRDRSDSPSWAGTGAAE